MNPRPSIRVEMETPATPLIEANRAPQAHATLRLELHNLLSFLAVEELVGRFGAQRLIFGAYMPVHDPNATMMQVTHARIPDADKARTARGSLAVLLGEVRTA